MIVTVYCVPSLLAVAVMVGVVAYGALETVLLTTFDLVSEEPRVA